MQHRSGDRQGRAQLRLADAGFELGRATQRRLAPRGGLAARQGGALGIAGLVVVEKNAGHRMPPDPRGCRPMLGEARSACHPANSPLAGPGQLRSTIIFLYVTVVNLDITLTNDFSCNITQYNNVLL